VTAQVPEPALETMPTQDHDRVVATYHLRLLVLGGYLEARTQFGVVPQGLSLTMAGQRLLDELRSAPPLARAVGEGAARLTTSFLVSLLITKLRAAGLSWGI
jgi:hypothetical protein